MDNFFENLNKISKNLHLDQNRKAEFRNELIKFMNANPVKPQTAKVSVFMRTISYFKIHRTALVPLMACAILVVGAGTSFAAEGAMPGDALYSVKVYVNEEVQAALIFNADEKAAFEINRAEIRLAEADGLAASGNLSLKMQAQVEANLNANTERVQRRIKKLEETGDTQKAADLASHFEASLKAHSNVLAAIGSSKESDHNNDHNFLDFTKNVNSTATGLGKQRGDLNLKISSEKNETKIKASASGKIRAAENTISEAKKFIELKAQNSQNSTEAAKEHLKAAGQLLVDAKAKFETGNYRESFELASKAQGTALRAKAIVKVEIRLPERVKRELPNSIIRQEIKERDDDSNNDRGSDRDLTPKVEVPRISF